MKYSGFSKHQEEYDSLEWQEIREDRLMYDDYTCQDCNMPAEQVHHLRYPAKSVDDCISLCEECHLSRHGKDSWD